MISCKEWIDVFNTFSKTLKARLQAGSRQAVVCLAAGFLLNGLAFGADGAAADAAPALPRLLALLTGRFDNLQQMAFVAAQPAGDKKNHYEAMRSQSRPVNSKQLDGTWLYGQTDKIDPGDTSKSKVYRQILQQFFVKDGQIFSRPWRFNDPAIKQQGTPSEDFLQQISLQQISMVMPEACVTRWTPQGEQFIGRIESANCVIQSKYKNEKRRLFAEEIIFPSGAWFREGAYGEDGSLAFGLEEGYYVRFNRQLPTKP
jgi:hypothetical protein